MSLNSRNDPVHELEQALRFSCSYEIRLPKQMGGSAVLKITNRGTRMVLVQLILTAPQRYEVKEEFIAVREGGKCFHF